MTLKPNQLPQTNGDFLTIRDLMRLSHESESAWRKRIGRREIAYIKLGNNVRIRRSDLETWLNEHTVPARIVKP